MKLKKLIFVILFSFFILLLWNCNSLASGDLTLNNLNYKVTLNSDGTANVTEIWDISIEDTNTLFKTFKLNQGNFSGFKDVSLVETTNGTRKEFTQIYQEMYHVTKNCFYALNTSSSEFEIAWGISVDGYARRTFEMNYTIIDAVTNYADASEFYWQFISTSSAIPAKKVTGIITLPTEVADLNDLRVGAHGPLNGNIERKSNNTVYFEVDNLTSRTMLEARVVTPTYVFADNENTYSSAKLDSIIAQETKWADEANAKREQLKKQETAIRIAAISFVIITNIAGIFLAVVFVKKIKKYKEELEIAPSYKPTIPSKYFRDIPNETSSAAQAAFVYYFKNSSISIHTADIISATTLNLCLKKFLTFEMLSDKKNNIKIFLNTNMDENLLTETEKVVFNMYKKVSTTYSFTMKDFQKYCKNHSSSCLTSFNSIAGKAKTEAVTQANFDLAYEKNCTNWSLKGIGYVFLVIISPLLMIANLIPSIICAYYSCRISIRYNTLTQKGVDEQEAWKGLKNYMDDFSMMNEKEVPELVLWEKYLVFATAFGIADKVLKQLKVVYPQMLDETYMNANGYYYLYLMSHTNFNNNFIHSINSSITSTYNSVNYSSGSGSGGGFSGGGGFGGGGGRNGRPLIAIRDSPQLQLFPNWGLSLIGKNTCNF